MCVTVTLLDGLVLARAVFHHSMRCGSRLGKGRNYGYGEGSGSGLGFPQWHIRSSRLPSLSTELVQPALPSKSDVPGQHAVPCLEQDGLTINLWWSYLRRIAVQLTLMRKRVWPAVERQSDGARAASGFVGP